MVTSPNGFPLNAGPALKLHVTIVHAAGLKQQSHASDAGVYVVCSVLHASGKRTKMYQTEARPHTEHPVWNEGHVVEPWHAGDPIEFVLYERNPLRDKLLGKAVLPNAEYGFEGELLMNGEARLYVQVKPLGAATEYPQLGSVTAEGPPQDLHVTVGHADGLKHLNHYSKGMYVVCCVVHAERRASPTRCQTQLESHTLSPHWNKEFELHPWHVGEPIEFAVYDKGLFGSKLAGKAVLPADYFCNHHGFEGELPIAGIPGARIYVQVLPRGMLSAPLAAFTNGDPQHLPARPMTPPAQNLSPLEVELLPAPGPHCGEPAPQVPVSAVPLPTVSPVKAMSTGLPKQLSPAPQFAWSQQSGEQLRPSTGSAVTGMPSSPNKMVLASSVSHGRSYRHPNSPFAGRTLSSPQGSLMRLPRTQSPYGVHPSYTPAPIHGATKVGGMPSYISFTPVPSPGAMHSTMRPPLVSQALPSPAGWSAPPSLRAVYPTSPAFSFMAASSKRTRTGTA